MVRSHFMPRFLHLSDLHFGARHIRRLSDLILDEIARWKPDVVVISGDFTQRGRHSEYKSARDYLSKITLPTLVIPGNHDQPFYAPIERLIRPLGRYCRYISASADMALNCAGMFFVGLNDNRPVLPGGFWSPEQRTWIREQLAQAPDDALKVVVSHHHFLWDGKWRPAGFWYPGRTLEWLARQGVSLVLNGHTHIPVATETPQGVIVVRAGTATCSRTRQGWGNTYNVVTLDDERISISVEQYDEATDAFVQVKEYAFARKSNSV